MAKRVKVMKAWGGFCNDALDAGWLLSGRYDTTPIVSAFTTRAEARKWFADVRRVEIREVPRKCRGGSDGR